MFLILDLKLVFMPVVVAAEEPVHHLVVQETTVVLMESQDHLLVEHLHPDHLV